MFVQRFIEFKPCGCFSIHKWYRPSISYLDGKNLIRVISAILIVEYW
uniref:Uncharacterized protein n=1 Tax=Onchocerca volvulus TaxID=6282 RepID=A0A8R1TW80_ONCVO